MNVVHSEETLKFNALDERGGVSNEPLENMHVTVRQNGRSWHTTANPDSGAKVNLCSLDRVQEMGLDLSTEQGACNLVGVNDQTLQFDGIVNLTIEFQSKQIETCAVVSSSITDKFLVGRQDLKRLDVLPQNFPARIQQKNHALQFNAAECPPLTEVARQSAAK